MERLPGHDLTRHVTGGRPAALAAVLEIGAQVAEALAYPTRRAWCTATSPANVGFDPARGRVKVTD